MKCSNLVIAILITCVGCAEPVTCPLGIDANSSQRNGFCVRSDHLLITTADGAVSKSQIRMYPVQDLVLGIRGGRVIVDFDTVIDAITSTVDPDQWEENGGNGAIEGVPVTGTLVISQSLKNHKRIEAFLAALRQSRDSQGIQVLPPNLQPAPDARAEQGGSLGGGLGGGPAPAPAGQAPSGQGPGGGLFDVRDENN